MKEVALVTGAAKRIGRVIALRLAREGWSVAVHYRSSREEAIAAQAEIESEGGRAAVFQAELGDAEACLRLMREAGAALGPVTLLVNSASVFAPDGPWDFSATEFDRRFAVNLRAPLLLARGMAQALPPDQDGAIVNILDQRVFKPTPLFFSYALTKAALHAATAMTAQAFAPRIRVNAVAPGPTLPNERQSLEDFAQQARATILGAPVSPEEIAEAVVYLARAKKVTGQTISVDSGQRLAWETPDVAGVRE